MTEYHIISIFAHKISENLNPGQPDLKMRISSQKSMSSTNFTIFKNTGNIFYNQIRLRIFEIFF